MVNRKIFVQRWSTTPTTNETAIGIIERYVAWQIRLADMVHSLALFDHALNTSVELLEDPNNYSTILFPSPKSYSPAPPTKVRCGIGNKAGVTKQYK